jgi:peptidyl-tRNA hydrolase, PTH1 family
VWLLVGLGNPGPEYARSRHNIGFMVLDVLASRWRAPGYRGKFGGELATGVVQGEKSVLLKPMEYMNLSGQSVGRTAGFYQIEPAHILVAHDDIDLELGRLKVKIGGGHAGHKGVSSIQQHLGTPEFVRVRCGVGRPAGKGSVAGYVLDDFGKAEKVEVDIVLQEAADAIEEVMGKGLTSAMNRFNLREKTE